MRYTNNSNLPAPVCRAIEWVDSRHSKGEAELSCTGLKDSPLIDYLKNLHVEDIVVDYASRLWSLYGTIMHSILSNFSVEGDGQLLEEKVYSAYYDPEFRISGEIDYLVGNKVADYKFTSSWNVLAGVKEELEEQLNIYIDMLRHSDNPEQAKLAEAIDSADICAMLRDWGPRLKAQIPDQVVMMPVKVWEPAKAEAFIKERIALHKAARALGTMPPECSEKERWIREEDVAVQKESNKTPSKCFKIKDFDDVKSAVEAANAYVANGEKGCTESNSTVRVRKTDPRRCIDYCDVAEFCPYYQHRKEEGDGWL